MSIKRGGARDFVAIADAYARDALADVDGEKQCRWMRFAASRYVKDRRRAATKGGPFKFSLIHAREVCNFIEQLPHVEGKWETRTIVLHPAHIFFLVNLFGFRSLDGTRRFTSALFAVARKNAKSTLSAAIMLYCLCYEPEPGPQVISAATTGDQARIIFNIARRMVEQTQDLRAAFNLEVFANAITNWQVAADDKAPATALGVRRYLDEVETRVAHSDPSIQAFPYRDIDALLGEEINLRNVPQFRNSFA